MVRWPLQPLQPLQKTQLQPPVRPSVDSPCHPWFTTTNLSYRFPIFETSATALCGTTGNYQPQANQNHPNSQINRYDIIKSPKFSYYEIMTLIFHNCHLNIIMIWWSDLDGSSDDSITIFEDKLRHDVWVMIMNHYRLRELPFDSFIVPNTLRLYHCKLIYCRNIFCDI